MFYDSEYVSVWAPESTVGHEAIAIDTEIASKMKCPKCGGPCRYGGYVDRHGSYIAVAVCKKCGYETAF